MYDYPQTANQEIGWFAKPLANNSKWNKPVKSSHITGYVSNYYGLYKINPFKLKGGSLKMA